MGNIAPAPPAVRKKPQGVKEKRTKNPTESHRLWSKLVTQYDQLFAMMTSYDRITQAKLTKEQAELKKALADYFEAPALHTALGNLAREHPKREMPKCFVRGRDKQAEDKERDDGDNGEGREDLKDVDAPAEREEA